MFVGEFRCLNGWRWSVSKNSLACTQNPLFVTSHGGLDMIFRDPTCPYGAAVVAVVVYVMYIIIDYLSSAHYHTTG